MGVAEIKSIEKNLWRTVGDVVAIGVGNEDEFGRTGCKDSAIANFESADEIEFIGKYFVGFEGTVAVLVFENNNAVISLFVRTSKGIGEGFGDPNPATAIEGESDGLTELRFVSDGLDLEAFGNPHPIGRLTRLGCGIFFEVPKKWAGAKTPGRSDRGVFMEAKIIVVEVPPWTGMFVDDPGADRFSEVLLEVDMETGHLLDFASSAGFVDEISGAGVDDLNAGFRSRSRPDEVAGPRMGDLEGLGGEGSLFFVTLPFFVSPDPK